MAIDPFEPELKPSPEAMRWLRPWLERENAILDVVYVLNCSDASHAFFDSCTIAEQQLRQTVSEFNLSIPVNPLLLVEQSTSTRHAVQSVIEYAAKISAEMILLTSYGRKLVGRIVLGSFADRLLALSPIPVLFMNQYRRPAKDAKRVLFPTDFSPASRAAFDLFLEQSKGIAPEIVLLHVLTSMAAIYDFAMIDSNISFPKKYFEEVIRFVEDESARWIAYARENGFNIRFILERKNNNVVRTITDIAKQEQVGLIALASSKVEIPTRVLGSVASSLFYQRNFPIWICGPETIKQEFNKIEEGWDQDLGPTRRRDLFPSDGLHP